MALVFHTVMFPSKFFVLIFSCLVTKDVPLGKFIISGTVRLPSTIFCLVFFFFYHPNFFLILILLPHLKLTQQQMLKVLFEIPFLFIFFIFLFYISILIFIFKTPFFTDCFPLILINHHQSD